MLTKQHIINIIILAQLQRYRIGIFLLIFNIILQMIVEWGVKPCRPENPAPEPSSKAEHIHKQYEKGQTPLHPLSLSEWRCKQALWCLGFHLLYLIFQNKNIHFPQPGLC